MMAVALSVVTWTTTVVSTFIVAVDVSDIDTCEVTSSVARA